VPAKDRSNTDSLPAGADREPQGLLERFLAREAGWLEERRRDLAVATEALSLLGSRGADGGPGSPVEALSAELTAGVVSRLLRDTTGVTRSYVMAVDEGPALEELTMRDNEARIRDGLVQRAIYPVSALGTPHGLRWIHGWAAIGEEQRVIAEAATEFAVFGSDAVVGLARWGEMSSGYVMTRERIVVEAYTAYFDLAWERALPVPVAPEDEDADERLVKLLGMGLKDEAIARYLGIGLRTVRRRVARLMAVHGVETRFQLGAAVERAGVDRAGHRRRPGR
jgi:DNA-binding CsgD family transcriptional regulator